MRRVASVISIACLWVLLSACPTDITEPEPPDEDSTSVSLGSLEAGTQPWVLDRLGLEPLQPIHRRGSSGAEAERR